ncbi:YceD family protein [Marinobacter sp. CHS3-4]|uniref:YceD family protein n=1 Tax=Marinobacter sp. CHS3-4 TaxID=3045174 RepID=UPI0024B4B4EE|nr:YceD family protein [Marinobacter sp. CHS3-4]MDI9245808.1 YceD family protein [Marinobacter sp. CHS3-4]
MPKASTAELPKSVDPFRLAEQNAVLEGVIPLKALSRFRDAVRSVDEDSKCQVTLEFSLDSERRRMVIGKLEAPVVLECQRCMGDLPHTLISEFSLGLVTTDAQAQNLPKELEPFLTDDFSADLWSMTEDELLLVLPPFPLHERDECPASETLEALEPEGDEEPEQKSGDNPFSVLADLKTKKH